MIPAGADFCPMGNLVDGGLIERPRWVKGRPWRHDDVIAAGVVRECAHRQRTAVIGTIAAVTNVRASRRNQLLGGLEIGRGVGLLLVLVGTQFLCCIALSLVGAKTVNVRKTKNFSSSSSPVCSSTTVLVTGL